MLMSTQKCCMQETLPALLIGFMKVNAGCINVPFLMWSPEKPALLARIAANALYVYSGCDMTLIGKKPLALEGIQDARWSPQANILAVYQVRPSWLCAPKHTQQLDNALTILCFAKCWGMCCCVHAFPSSIYCQTDFIRFTVFPLNSNL